MMRQPKHRPHSIVHNVVPADASLQGKDHSIGAMYVDDMTLSCPQPMHMWAPGYCDC